MDFTNHGLLILTSPVHPLPDATHADADVSSYPYPDERIAPEHDGYFRALDILKKLSDPHAPSDVARSEAELFACGRFCSHLRRELGSPILVEFLSAAFLRGYFGDKNPDHLLYHELEDVSTLGDPGIDVHAQFTLVNVHDPAFAIQTRVCVHNKQWSNRPTFVSQPLAIGGLTPPASDAELPQI